MPVHGTKRVNMLSHFGNASSLNFNTVTSELGRTCFAVETRSECETNRRTQLIDLLNIVIIVPLLCTQVLLLSTRAALLESPDNFKCTVCLCTPYWLFSAQPGSMQKWSPSPRTVSGAFLYESVAYWAHLAYNKLTKLAIDKLGKPC